VERTIKKPFFFFKLEPGCVSKSAAAQNRRIFTGFCRKALKYRGYSCGFASQVGKKFARPAIAAFRNTP
jgi:hypothetical protein